MQGSFLYMVISNSRQLLYPSFHLWKTNNPTIKLYTGSQSFNIINYSGSHIKVPVVNINNMTNNVKVTIVQNNKLIVVVRGTIQQLNQTFISDVNTNQYLSNSAFVQLTKHMVVSSALIGEQQLYLKLKQESIDGYPLSQLVSYAIIKQAKTAATNLLRYLKIIPSNYVVDDSIMTKLNLNCDFVLVHKHYIQKRLAQKDQRLISDRRFQTFYDHNRLLEAIVESRLAEKMIIPINITGTNVQGLINEKGIPLANYKFINDTKIQTIKLSRLFDNCSIILNNGVVINPINPNTQIIKKGAMNTCRYSTLKTSLRQVDSTKKLVTYKDDIPRLKSILNVLTSNIIDQDLNVDGTRRSIDYICDQFMDLDLDQQVTASETINFLYDFINTITVDNCQIMLYYISNLPRSSVGHKSIKMK